VRWTCPKYWDAAIRSERSLVRVARCTASWPEASAAGCRADIHSECIWFDRLPGSGPEVYPQRIQRTPGDEAYWFGWDSSFDGKATIRIARLGGDAMVSRVYRASRFGKGPTVSRDADDG
jgi:hypothetical protein